MTGLGACARESTIDGGQLPRVVEARVSVDAAHAPVCETGTPPDACRRVDAITRRAWIRDARRVDDPTAAARAAAALLALGDTAAVEPAREAIHELLDSARPPADVLAAAGALAHASARMGHGQQLLILALEYTLRALEADPESEVALFNRALVQDDLGLCWTAARSWQAFLGRDSTSSWANEARRRASRIPCRANGPSDSAPPPGSSADFEVAADSLLPTWLDARLESAGDLDEMSSAFSAVATRLEHEANDSLLALVSEELQATRDIVRLRAARAFTRGRALFSAQRYDEARSEFETAWAGLSPGGSVMLPWIRFFLVGVTMQDRGAQRAARDFGALLPEPALQASPWLRARVHWGLAVASGRTGRQGVALEEYEKAEADFTLGHYDDQVAAIQVLRAELLSSVAPPDLALALLPGAMRVLRRPRPHFTYKNALWAGAQLSSMLASPRAARSYLEEYRAVGVAEGDPSVGVEAVITEADLLRRAYDIPGAVAAYATGARMAASIGPRLLREQWMARARLGAIEASLNDDSLDVPSVRPEDIRELGELFRQAGPPALHLDALLAESSLARRSGDEAGANLLLGKATRVARSYVRDLPEGGAEEAYWRSMQSVFDAAIAASMDAGDPWTALAFLEDARRPPGRESAKPAAIRFEVRGETWRALGLLPPVVLSFAVVRDRIAWWRISESERASGWLDPSSAAVLLARLRDAAGAPPSIKTIELLNRVLMAPTLGGVRDAGPLIVVPDGMLQYVPFAALTDPVTGRRVVEDRSVSLRRSVLAATQPPPIVSLRRDRPWRALVVGDPSFETSMLPLERLPGARREASAVAALYGGHAVLLIGDSATSEAVRMRLDQAEVLHMATHALPSRFGGSGAFALAAGATGKGGITPVAALLDGLSRVPTLVVLSACSTLGTEPLRSGGVVGLADPFLSAGSSAVVASLWPMDDERLETLSVAFHRSLLSGASAADALRTAQLDAFEASGADCCSWAGLELIGDVLPSADPLPSPLDGEDHALRSSHHDPGRRQLRASRGR